jgi:hypothetical protein
MEEKKKEALQIGFGVLILLIILTIGEYWVGSVAATWWAPIMGIALIKAFFVVRDYMHIGRVFAGDEEVH